MNMSMMSTRSHDSPMRDFYAGKTILVTGASGFLGKVLVEKLLYSCEDIETIYILIRPQNGSDCRQRLDKILTSPIFERCRQLDASRFAKLIPISADLMQPEMALAQPDMHRLCDTVNIVFHCAATVKFDDHLRCGAVTHGLYTYPRVSVEMNVLGTQRLIALCHKMRKLDAVVHTSTAYANCDRTRIVESIYPPPVQPQKLIDALELGDNAVGPRYSVCRWMNDDMIDALTPFIVGRRPNTYTLTKALAEFLLVEESAQLPLTIVRPSIIGATCAEPLVGWTDNLNGPTGLMIAVGKGMLTNMRGDTTGKADIVPVDVVSNLMIAAAWNRATQKHDSIPVINCCSGRLNPVRWGRISDYLEHFYTTVPVEGAMRYPSAKFHPSKHVFEINVGIKHLLPAYIIDLCSRLVGKKPKMVRLYGRLLKIVETLHYFTQHEWDFQTKRMIELWDSMSTGDQKTFYFDIRQLNWDSYLHDYMLGVKRYILKDNMADATGAIAHLSRIRAITICSNTALTALVVRFMTPKHWRTARKWLLFIVASLVQIYMLMRVRRVAGAPAPQLELYGQSFTCPRALTLTNSTHNLKMLTEKNM